MELNYKCIRDILLLIEQKQKLIITDSDNLVSHLEELDCTFFIDNLEKCPKEDVIYTLKKLSESNFLDAEVAKSNDNDIIEITVYEMTYEGHQFLASIKNKNVWEKFLEAGKALDTFPLNIIASIAAGICEQAGKNILGL